MKHMLRRGALAGLIVLAAGLGMTVSAAESKLPVAANKDVIYKDDAQCTRCHDENEVKPVLSIAKTKHGVASDARTPTCITCHGESKAHGDKPEEVQVRPATDRNFGANSKLTAEQKSKVCFDCHQGGKHMNWNTSLHAARNVACTNCHQVHTGHDKVRDKRAQPDVCYTCHKQQRADANKPSHHPIPEGKMTCSDCHNAHGSPGPKMLVKDTVNDTCYLCHAEKRGPFVHNHQPVTENCGNCHNPHGTTAEAMLKTRMPFLCQQCHGSSAHPGNMAGTRTGMPNAISTNIGPGMGQARACANCHTNIHGSNSPSNQTSSGPARFFR
ncbi:MAG: DmsE family decaheme c-type cytochrome [Betaproteobacteria bacterium]|nr:DmsE family decaheme c-type cytochrome [Betaproteobacteria bacterium]